MKTKYLITAFIFTLFVGCNKKDNYQAIFYDSGNKTIVNECEFYSTDKGAIYFHISDKSLQEHIYQKSIDSITLKLNNKIFKAAPINLFYSRERPLSDFVFPVDNKTKKIVVDQFDNKSMFTLASQNINIEKLNKSGFLKVRKIISD